MNKLFALAGLGTLLAFAPQAGAVTLTNQDDMAYGLEIMVGEGSPSVEELSIGASESLGEICMDGCVIRLDNGQEFTFSGDETAEIRDGEFVLTE